MRERPDTAGTQNSQRKSRSADPAAPTAGQWQHSDIMVQVLWILFYPISFQSWWPARGRAPALGSEVEGSGSDQWGGGQGRLGGGKGGYKFRGLHVAAKCLYQVILSDYNLRQFTREMTIAAKLRHPNLLLFIGATREGEPVILTELMPTSLRRELERREMPRVQITSICHDLARALCYLHQWKPYPIIHRDISSGNVLLEPLPNGWRAKVSDYGSANFMNLVSTTTGPGNPFYAAPEASSPHQHSPKMDTYSFGVLLVEMSLRELPKSRPERREEQIQHIQWPAMVSLIRSYTRGLLGIPAWVTSWSYWIRYSNTLINCIYTSIILSPHTYCKQQ